MLRVSWMTFRTAGSYWSSSLRMLNCIQLILRFLTPKANFLEAGPATSWLSYAVFFPIKESLVRPGKKIFLRSTAADLDEAVIFVVLSQ